MPKISKDKGKKYIGKYGLTTNWELEQMGNLLGFGVWVLSKNELKNQPLLNGNYIINMQDSDKGSGTHWVALKVYPNEAFYYNSFGLLPPLEVIYFVNPPYLKGNQRRSLYICNKQIQNIYGAYCGQYCTDFLRYMTREHQNRS
jgi:hypothetical protein